MSRWFEVEATVPLGQDWEFQKGQTVRLTGEDGPRDYLVTRKRRNNRLGHVKIWMTEIQPGALEALKRVAEVMRAEG